MQAQTSNCPSPSRKERRSARCGVMWPMPCSATACCKSALASGCSSTAAQGPRCPRSCHSRLTMPQPEHRSAAVWLRFGSQKRASKSASEPNRWTAEQYTSVLLYKISVECSICPAEILRQNILSQKMKNLCNKEKQQTRTTGLLLLMRYSRGCLLKIIQR